MSLLRPRRRTEARSRPAALPLSAYASLFTQTASGVPVGQDNAVRAAAVAACVRILKTTVAMLPVDEVTVSGRVRRPVDTPSPVVARPSARVSRRAWVAQVMHSLLTNGNYYALVVATDRVGRPVQVESVAPKDVTWISRGNVEVPYVAGEERDIWPLGDLIHIPASAFLCPGRVVADSPVDLARESIGTALAAERFGSQFFGDGAHPSSIVYSDQELDEPAAGKIKQAFLRATSGGREPAVLGSGLKYEQIQINPQDSQFLDLLRFEVEQACRFWGVPPQMVYAAVSGQSVTYANVNQADLQFLKYSVAHWIADIEDAWSSWIDDPRTVKFNINALLRMDTPTRFKSHETALRSGWLSVNEVRRLEDLEDIPDGDQYLWPPWRQFPMPDADDDPDEVDS